MEVTVYNPQKGRLETIEAQITEETTTWFQHEQPRQLSMITDLDGDMLISELDYS